MTKDHSESRSTGASEAERRYDGGGQDTPMAQSEKARGNEEPEVDAEVPEIPPAALAGEDGKPIPVQNDNGVAWAEIEGKA